MIIMSHHKGISHIDDSRQFDWRKGAQLICLFVQVIIGHKAHYGVGIFPTPFILTFHSIPDRLIVYITDTERMVTTMRNLTIKRNKTFVGCACKDLVYIRDFQNPEITIEGVPCRKLGQLKNGEEKTFTIGFEEQQIFLIADLVSKERYNASVTIPEGQEDVSFSGKHHFSLGSNPFRFDGVPLSEAEIAKQKKNNRKGAVIWIAAVIIGAVIGLYSSGLFGIDTVSPKTFTKEGFEITLTDTFQETELDGFFACYESKSAFVFVIQEEKDMVGNISLDEYTDLVLQANARTDVKRNTTDDYIWFTFTDTPDQQELYYMAVCCEGADSFWVITFSTPSSNRDQYHETFLEWADSLKLG